MADDWVHCPNSDGTEGPLVNACYVWLPIHFHENNVSIEWRSAWKLEDPFAEESVSDWAESVSNWTTASATKRANAINSTLTYLFL
jgi:hypothetical protein